MSNIDPQLKEAIDTVFTRLGKLSDEEFRNNLDAYMDGIFARHEQQTLNKENMKQLKLRALHDRVIVIRDENEVKLKSGIIIPDTAQAAEKPDQGVVVAVGPGKYQKDGKIVPLEVKVGDKILFGKYSGQAVKIEGVEYVTMTELDVLCIIG